MTKIVAIGDSITFGYDSSDPATKSWPSQLTNMLHDSSKYEVVNLGLNGRCMLKTGWLPYWNEPQYRQALESNADIVVLMLGTNDAFNQYWDETKFIEDYLEMSRSFLNMPSKPELYIMVPPPLY